MNQQRYGRSPIPRRAGLPATTNQGYYSDDVQVDADDCGDDDNQWLPPMPRSAIRYTTTPPSLPIPQAPIAPAPVITVGGRRYVLHANPPPQQAPRRNTPPPQPQVRKVAPPPHPQYDDEEDEQPTRPHHQRRVHPLFILGLGMALMLLLWIVGSAVINWWGTTQDDWQYGRPRTYQIDAVVGHNHDSLQSPSHFIALNFHSHIQIIEFPAGDTSKAKIYAGPVISGDDQDLAPVTLDFRDVNGDGKPDMIIIVASTHVVLINDGIQFRMLKPGEQVEPY